MRKTTVYLTDDEAEGLRRAAARTGRSQSELIREGIRSVVGQDAQRVFHSMGVADSGDPTLAARTGEILRTEWVDHLLRETGPGEASNGSAE